jgi:hypothetical protein
VSLLAIPERISVTTTALKWKRVKVGGKWVRRRVRVRIRVLVANPRLAQLVSEAEAVRRAAPYAIDCSTVTP